uniref:Uncharacterized protein n=1 Tax=viral metagenome TaxID=1070528 RepID=A0A6C0H8F4_9ZZZZ
MHNLLFHQFNYIYYYYQIILFLIVFIQSIYKMVFH